MNKKLIKEIVEANADRNPGDPFINEYGEITRAKILLYTSPNEITLAHKNKNILTNYKITGEVVEVPIIRTFLFKNSGIFENDPFQKIIDEALSKNTQN